MDTKVYSVSAIDDETLRRAELLREEEAVRLVASQMELIEEAGRVIAGGGLVAFPTETVYGIGADALNEEAVRKVYAAKGRPSDNPMIVHIARASDAGLLAKRITPDFVRLAEAFWPGPLTIIMERSDAVPHAVTGGLETVAIRLPDHPAARALIKAACTPVAAPSANLSGSPSPTSAEHVISDLSGKVDIILAGGTCRVGIESTVVDITGEAATVLRPGAISADQLSAALGRDVVYDAGLSAGAGAGDITKTGTEAGAGAAPAPKSPGMKYKHYAPKADMLVVEGQRDKVRAEVARLATLNEGLGRKVQTILFSEKTYIEAAHELYGEIRAADEAGAELIIAGALSDSYVDGVGFAVMNRMLKAAGYNVVKI